MNSDFKKIIESYDRMIKEDVNEKDAFWNDKEENQLDFNEETSFKKILTSKTKWKIDQLKLVMNDDVEVIPFDFTCNGNMIREDGKIGLGNELYYLILLNCFVNESHDKIEVVFEDIDEKTARDLIKFADEYVSGPTKLFNLRKTSTLD